MKICEYKKSQSFFDLGEVTQFLKLFFLRNSWSFETNFNMPVKDRLYGLCCALCPFVP